MVIEHDLFDIAWELKRIDPSYRVERRNGAFWLFSGKSKEPEMKLPYDKLDMRTVRRVRETRMARVEELLREMEEANAKSERESMRDACNKATDGVREMRDVERYQERHS